MPLIDTTYFIGDINIPNSDNPAVAERITGYIQKYEPEFLGKVLGYALYKAFIDGLNPATPTPTDPSNADNASVNEQTVTADQRWLDLRDGVEYTDLTGTLTRWKGLADVNDKSSLIANYVYYWYIRGVVTQSTGMGEVIPVADNVVNVSSALKMATAWNQMVDILKQLVCFLDAKLDTYPEWKNVSHWITYQGVYYYRVFSYENFSYINAFDF